MRQRYHLQYHLLLCDKSHDHHQTQTEMVSSMKVKTHKESYHNPHPKQSKLNQLPLPRTFLIMHKETRSPPLSIQILHNLTMVLRISRASTNLLPVIQTLIHPITKHMHNQQAITCFMTFHAHI